MGLTKAEVRLVVIGLIYSGAILFSKIIIGGYENESVYIVTVFVLLYLIFEEPKKRKNNMFLRV